MSQRNISRCDLLDIIDKTSFALDEARLYLDTHPKSKEASLYFQRMQEKRNMAIKEYTRLYGPITSYDVNPSNVWQWNEGPLPWQASYRDGRY